MHVVVGHPKGTHEVASSPHFVAGPALPKPHPATSIALNPSPNFMYRLGTWVIPLRGIRRHGKHFLGHRDQLPGGRLCPGKKLRPCLCDSSLFSWQ